MSATYPNDQTADDRYPFDNLPKDEQQIFDIHMEISRLRSRIEYLEKTLDFVLKLVK